MPSATSLTVAWAHHDRGVGESLLVWPTMARVSQVGITTQDQPSPHKSSTAGGQRVGSLFALISVHLLAWEDRPGILVSDDWLLKQIISHSGGLYLCIRTIIAFFQPQLCKNGLLLFMRILISICQSSCLSGEKKPPSPVISENEKIINI